MMTDDEIKRIALDCGFATEELDDWTNVCDFADRIAGVSELKGYDEGMKEVAGNVLQVLKRECSDIERIMLVRDYCLHLTRREHDDI